MREGLRWEGRARRRAAASGSMWLERATTVVMLVMAALRETAALNGGVMDEVARSRFGLLHGVASVIYLVQSLIGVALVLKIR